jgi:hypothetical protein
LPFYFYYSKIIQATFIFWAVSFIPTVFLFFKLSYKELQSFKLISLVILLGNILGIIIFFSAIFDWYID